MLHGQVPKWLGKCKTVQNQVLTNIGEGRVVDIWKVSSQPKSGFSLSMGRKFLRLEIDHKETEIYAEHRTDWTTELLPLGCEGR